MCSLRNVQPDVLGKAIAFKSIKTKEGHELHEFSLIKIN